MPAYDLTDIEAQILTGRCSPAAQAKVDAAKARIDMRSKLDVTPEIAGFVADVVTEARTAGRLAYKRISIRHCAICGTSGGYALWKSNTRNHDKGEKNYDKPLMLSGVDVAHRLVTVRNSACLGCCSGCWAKAEAHVNVELASVRVELPKHWPGRPHAHVYHPLVKCTACGWEGHEGQMRALPALFGGRYPGGCPECDAENEPLGATKIETLKGWVVLDAILGSAT